MAVLESGEMYLETIYILSKKSSAVRGIDISEYHQVINSLKRLYGYPNGRERVKKLAHSWRERYPRRTALLDELEQAKL